MRARPNLLKQFKLICPVQSFPQKYFCFLPRQITGVFRASRALRRGVSRSSRTLGAGCGGRGSVVARGGCRAGSDGPVSIAPARRRTALKRTAKPCGPGTRCWCQVGGGASTQPGLLRCQFADDGDKTNSSPGRARNKPLKPLRGECRAFSGVTVVTTVCSLPMHTGCGRVERPAFPAPSLEGRLPSP